MNKESLQVDIKPSAYAGSPKQTAVLGIPHLTTGMVIGCLILLTLVAASFLAPMLARHDPLAQELGRRLESPGADYLLGTDRLGRDIYSRLLYGARVSLTVAVMVVAIGVGIGIATGLISGYYGGKVDFIIQRGVDVVLAFPSILLAVGIMAFMGQGLLNLVIAISIVNIPQVTRLVRGMVLQTREMEFVQAAQAFGAQDSYVILRHIFPTAIGPIIVQATFMLVYAIRTEASLSFIGLGVPPPNPSWGGLLDDGKAYMQNAPWMIIAPGLAIALTILGLSLLGDGLRDYLDPRAKHAARPQ